MPRLADSAEQAAFRSRLREWLEAEAPAKGAQTWEGRVAWQRKLAEAGWLGLNWPKEHGGQGASLAEQQIYNQEMSRAGAPDLANGIGLMIAGPALIAAGSPEQQSRYLPPILSADEIWCQGFSEPNAGSDLAGLQTKAVSDGDHYVVTGQKIWSSNSRHASLCLLLARTDPEAPRHKGISAMVVDLTSPGVTVKPLAQITGDEEFGEIFFDGVRTPKANLVGAENEGWIVAMKTFTRERANIAMSLSSRLSRQVARLVEEARGRADDADIRRRVAQAWVDAETLRLTCERLGEQLYGFHSSLIKIAWAETNQKLQELGLSLLGPDAALLPPGEETWQFGYMRSRGNSIEGGTSEILRTIVAERVLGLPRMGR